MVSAVLARESKFSLVYVARAQARSAARLSLSTLDSTAVAARLSRESGARLQPDCPAGAIAVLAATLRLGAGLPVVPTGRLRWTRHSGPQAPHGHVSVLSIGRAAHLPSTTGTSEYPLRRAARRARAGVASAATATPSRYAVQSPVSSSLARLAVSAAAT
jgi:hypothetical protein